MSKPHITTALATVVLLIGLISCSRDQQNTRDVYQPPGPKIQRDSDKIDFGDWTRKPLSDLDLSDALDFTGAGPKTLKIHALCQIDDVVAQDNFTFQDFRELHVFQFVPEALLLVDRNVHRLACAFELNLYNSTGSNHIFNMSSVVITDKLRGLVNVSREPVPLPEPLSIEANRLEGVRIRFDSATNARVTLTCSDLQDITLNFNQVIDLAHHKPIAKRTAPDCRPKD